MQRPCIRCGRVIKRGSYCPGCNPRGGSWAQEKFRRATLATTGGRCARCGSQLDVQAHHLHPIGEGGHPQGPGEPLCRRCHRQVHR